MRASDTCPATPDSRLRFNVQVFDKQGLGSISTAELKHVLSSVGEKLSPEEMAEMLGEADPESSGKVTYDTFIKVMLAR